VNIHSKPIAAVILLVAGNLAQANTVYNILDVMHGSSGFGASLFHDASGTKVASGHILADILSISVVSGTFDDDTGTINVTMNVDTGGTFTLSGTWLLFDSSGTLAANSQLNITFSNPTGVLQNGEIGFLPGYVCCGRSDQDPNSFVAGNGNMVMSLWGADFGGGIFNGSYDDSSGNRLATYGMDLRLSMAPVPVPAAVWLFGSGLLGLVGVARHKRGSATTLKPSTS